MTSKKRDGGDKPVEIVEMHSNGPGIKLSDDDTVSKPTNEYVLNVAFLSFFVFTTLQLFFALLARSQAMMEDCAAMYVDVVTYLFNFLAERFKHKVGSESSLGLRKSRLYRLYLELIPPSISVVTLILVTIMGLRQSIAILREPDSEQHRQPDLAIMLSFSGLNLLLDILNVSCFASVDQAIGLDTLTTRPVNLHTREEETSLLTNVSDQGEREDDESSQDTEVAGGLNLNMCSAWTHICADTLRSVAVLVAAGFASLFPNLLTAADADSWAAIVVSVIILISLAPLFEGLYWTCCKIIDIHKGSWDVRHHSERHQLGYGATSLAK